MPTAKKKSAAGKKKLAAPKDDIASLKDEIKKLNKRCDLIEKWIKAEVKWSQEVTTMLHQINWAELKDAFPGGGGTNPPKTPPDWPPA